MATRKNNTVKRKVSKTGTRKKRRAAAGKAAEKGPPTKANTIKGRTAQKVATTTTTPAVSRSPGERKAGVEERRIGDVPESPKTVDAKGAKAGRRRKRDHVFPESHQYVDLSQATLRVAVRRVIELAVAYEASKGNAHFVDIGFADVDGVLDSAEMLEEVINLVAFHEQERKRRVDAQRVAVWRRELCAWLRKPATAAYTKGAPVDADFLGRRIADAFVFWELPVSKDALTELMTFARFPRTSLRELVPKRTAKVAGVLEKRVADVLRKHGVIDLSSHSLSNMRTVLKGGERAGKLKTPEQAHALLENNPVDPAALVLYTLLLLTGGERTDLVNEPMAALRNVVDRHMKEAAEKTGG